MKQTLFNNTRTKLYKIKLQNNITKHLYSTQHKV